MLRFLSLDLEQGYDSLRVYDGPTTASPLIGSFTGNTIPSPVAAISGIMTIRFHSDGATTKPGFKAYYKVEDCQTITWTGNVSTAWEDPNNWSCGIIPGSSSNVVINSGTIIIHSNVTINSLAINFGVNLTVGSGYSLTVLH